MKTIFTLNDKQVMQLHKLYKEEWWTNKRTLEETQKVVKNSQIVIAIIDENNELQAFVRILTDYVFKAFIFDLIVSEKQRGKGLGQKFMFLIKNHSELQEVKHFELYCLPEMLGFYEGFNFTDELGKLTFMRKTKG